MTAAQFQRAALEYRRGGQRGGGAGEPKSANAWS